MKRRVSLMRKMLTQFIVCVVVLLLLATPIFYWLTKGFYAEDMIDIIEAVKQGQPMPTLDLEQDIIVGLMIQYVLVSLVLGIAIILTMRFISGRLWKPFDQTLKSIDGFSLEEDAIPELQDCDVVEFARLNTSLGQLMTSSQKSYRAQKEFTENASHELQTPLAVFQGKLDILLQLPDITERQAVIIQDLYQMTNRLSRLNRNLLLLAKMENNQFERDDVVDVIQLVDELLPSLECLAGGLSVRRSMMDDNLEIMANRSLLESLVNNLVVNAVRHNRPGGEIEVRLCGRRLYVTNTSDEPMLDVNLIFNRFYRPSGKMKGSGLGLAIVKAVCDYHGWNIFYVYHDGVHEFSVGF